MILAIPLHGPDTHGAIAHARRLGRLVAASGAVVTPHVGDAHVVHVQFTDELWGSDAEAAATSYVLWARSLSVPIVVTGHDLPGSDRNAGRDQRRTRAYAEVFAHSSAVVVSSLHELQKARSLTTTAVHFVELPLPPHAEPRSDLTPSGLGSGGQTLGVLGFVYPNKGHLDVVAAAGRSTADLRVVVAGSIAPGHGALEEELSSLAASSGVRLQITGRLDSPAWQRVLTDVDIPVMPNPAPSASASLLAWVGAGRRPLVRRSDYASEVLRRHPGIFEMYEQPEVLDRLIRARLAIPSSSWRAPGLGWPDTGAEHLAIYRKVLSGQC